MRELILVNRAVTEQRMDGTTTVKLVEPRIIPISGILEVSPLSRKIKEEDVPEEIKPQVKEMSLDADLGGSLIILSGRVRDAYMTVLETPEAIYRKIYSD